MIFTIDTITFAQSVTTLVILIKLSVRFGKFVQQFSDMEKRLEEHERLLALQRFNKPDKR